MYFHKYRLLKTLLDKSLKSRASKDPSTLNMSRNSVAMWMAAPLRYLLITMEIITLEKVSFSDIENPKTVC